LCKWLYLAGKIGNGRDYRLYIMSATGWHEVRWNHRIDIWRATRRRRRFSAPVIAITGSSGKSTTSALLAHVLEGYGAVGKQIIENGALSIAWMFLKMPIEKRYVVVEAGVGKPGDMRPIARIVQPDVAIVTMVASEHYKSFRGEDAVACEKGLLVEALPSAGLAVLNGDDPHVRRMAERTVARVIRFGQSADCDYRFKVSDLTLSRGMSLELHTPSGVLMLYTQARVSYFSANYAAAAATALELGVPAELVQERMASFPGVRDRFEYRRPNGGPHLILDVAKAPHHSLENSFLALDSLGARRKRIVIGQIADRQATERKTYREAIRAALDHADEVIVVGENAVRAGRKYPEKTRLIICETPQDASRYLRQTANQDDLILLKSARNLHLERLAIALEEDVGCWKPVCKIVSECQVCGLYSAAPDRHATLKRKIWLENALRPLKRFLPFRRTSLSSK